jgi:hypothetical protein
MAKYNFALALQGLQATYATILVAMISKHTQCYVSTKLTSELANYN